MFDAVLGALRAFHELCVHSIVGRGEGAMAAITLLSDTIRQNAYRERRVPERESEKLEERALGLAHAFLLAPQVHPVRFYMPFLRENS